MVCLFCRPGGNVENFQTGDTSEEEEDDEDTVYECPGLAAVSWCCFSSERGYQCVYFTS